MSATPSSGHRVRGELHQQLVRARALLGRARAALRTYPNVVGVGVGVRKRGKRHVPEACFVVEVSRKPRKPKRALPAAHEGVPIDVQQRGALELCAQPGSRIRRADESENGRTGLIARDVAGKRYAFTAMHVLGPDRLGLVTGADAGFAVQLGEADDAITGTLVYGVFDPSRDVACVALPDAGPLSADVGGTGFSFNEPSPLGVLEIGATVGIIIRNQAVYEGKLVAYPLHGTDTTFLTDLDVSVSFYNLAKFAFKTDAGAPLKIQQGWSGSVIYRSDTFSPIALLSFRDGSQEGAYGFPVYPAMRAGGLTIWKG